MSRSGSPGEWLFEQRWVAWMYDPTLQRQLPFLYRLFAAYCQTQRPWVKSQRIKFGPGLFKVLVKTSQLLSLPSSLQLELPDGTFLFVNLADPRFFRAVNELLNPDEETSVLATVLKPGDTFIDIGANHGSFSVKAFQFVKEIGFILAVEPQPQLSVLVDKSLLANGCKNHTVHGVACGDDNGQLTFYIPKDTSGSAGVFPAFSATHEFQELSVPVRRFDDFVDWHQLPGDLLVKLDIEGSEYSFLKGASEMIRTRKPFILMEVNVASMEAAQVAWPNLRDFLLDLGYETYQETKDLSKQHSLQALAPDPKNSRNILLVPSLRNG